MTHYTDQGTLDRDRIEAHLRTLAPFASGWLVPGSTGDGWELSREEIRQLLDLVSRSPQEHQAHVLIGCLREDAAAAAEEIDDLLAWMQLRSGTLGSGHGPGTAPRVWFHCLPSGRSATHANGNRDRVDVDSATERSPGTVSVAADHAERDGAIHRRRIGCSSFANFYLFKDTSGFDRVAVGGVDLQNVFLVRGAEGEYLPWYKAASGPYDGFLLSSANVFAERLHRMITAADQGNHVEAQAAVRAIAPAITQALEWAQVVPVGNAFTNANKAIDHFMAYGPSADQVPPPRLHAGPRLEVDLIQRVGRLLQQLDLMPATGYLENTG